MHRLNSMLISVSSKMKKIKYATIKVKNKFVPLRVAPKRIENNFKGH